MLKDDDESSASIATSTSLSRFNSPSKPRASRTGGGGGGQPRRPYTAPQEEETSKARRGLPWRAGGGVEGRLLAVCVGQAGFAALELVNGVLTGRTALVSEAMQSALGGAVLWGCLGAVRAARAGADGRFPHGLGRLEVVAALACACHMVFWSFSLVSNAMQEAVEAAEEGFAIGGGGAGATAALKVLLDGGSITLLHRHGALPALLGWGGPGYRVPTDMAVHGVVAILAGDALRRGGDILHARGGGGGAQGACLAVAVAGMLLLLAMPLASRAGRLLLQAAPRAVDEAALRKCLRQAAAHEGVVSCHGARLWELSPGSTTAAVGSLEVVVRPGTDEGLVIQHVHAAFEAGLGPVDLTAMVEVDAAVGMR